MKTKIVSALLCTLFTFPSLSQSLSINNSGSPAHPSAILDVTSDTKGLLIPRMTRTEKEAISAPATGLFIYQTGPDSTGFYYYTGTQWAWIYNTGDGDSLAWKVNGNAYTVDGIHFIGTTDNQPLNFRVNNEFAGRLDPQLHNSFYGYQSGMSNTSGVQNIAIGYRCLNNNQTGIGNIAIGTYALYGGSNTQFNIAIGTNALYNDTSGTYNTAIGDMTLYSNLSGGANVAVGRSALQSNLTGNSNAAFGSYALYSNLDGGQNTALGVNAMYYNTSGYANAACGYQALLYNTTGASNAAFGQGSLLYNTTGFENMAGGAAALFKNVSGNNNTSLGAESLYENISGSNNTALGFFAGHNALGSYNVYIGYEAGAFETGSNKLYIANSNAVNPLIGGDFSTGIVTINSVLTLKPGTAPAAPVKGMIYFDSVSNKLRCYDGTVWNDLW